MIFFDFGGTLVRTSSSETTGADLPGAIWETVLSGQDRAPAAGEIARALARTERELGHRIYDYVGRVDAFWRLYDDRVLDRLGIGGDRTAVHRALATAFWNASAGTPFPETEEVLRTLRSRGHYLGVISNHNDALLEILDHHRLRSYFSGVTYSQEAGADKPDPRIFRLALHRAGVRPSEAIHVGDSWGADVEGARGVGMRAVWLDREGRGAHPGAPRVSSLRELASWSDPGARTA